MRRGGHHRPPARRGTLRPFERPDLDVIARWADDLVPAVLVVTARMPYRLATQPREPITLRPQSTP